jgi:hypothetical protein
VQFFSKKKDFFSAIHTLPRIQHNLWPNFNYHDAELVKTFFKKFFAFPPLLRKKNHPIIVANEIFAIFFPQTMENKL